jgi:aromatic-L-amino-acid decarboxylase
MAQTDGIEGWQRGLGDMTPDDFRRHGHEVVEWIASYLEGVESHPVLSVVRPGDIQGALPVSPPDAPEAFNAIMRDFDQIVMPGITHWNHPSFFAYFAITGSAPGVLAEFLSAMLNVNAMMWRTSPSATELEMTALDWLRQLIGLPDDFDGVIYDTASISTLVAITAAREAIGADVRELGMAGRTDLPALTMYCSEQAHSSVEKAAITLGIGQQNVRKITTDGEFRMEVDSLERAIEADLSTGRRPFCVVATVGTTATTSVDPVRAIANVCRKYGLWLHVDAAYGGVAAVLPEMRWIMDGVEMADSLVVNPHKWLFTPIDLSAFFSRRLADVEAAFSLTPPYLRTAEGDSVRNFMNYGPQLGRRFRALKLWFVLRSFGRDGIAARIREHIRLAAEFASWVEESSHWTLFAPVHFSTVTFRVTVEGMSDEARDALTERLEARVNSSGEMFLAHTVLSGRVVLRLALGNLRTEERHVLAAWSHLNEALRAELASGTVN